MKDNKINFTAEITEVKMKKAQSLDKEYRIMLVTDSIESLKLAEIPADNTVKVSITET